MAKTTSAKAVRSSAYLPKPPDEYAYEVRLVGPHGDVAVEPREGGYRVRVSPARSHGKSIDKPDLPTALRAAVDAVKALTKLANYEAEASAARRALIDAIGEDDTAATEPAGPEPPPAAKP